MERNIMTKLLFDFLIALAVVLAATAIIAFIVAKVISDGCKELKASTSGQVPLCGR
jgi:hypothetical protein